MYGAVTLHLFQTTKGQRVKIFGVTGTNGSGKDTVGEMLVERHNFALVSNSDQLREEARKRGLPVTRKNLSEISAEWRRKEGLGVLSKKSYNKFLSFDKKHDGLAIISLRHPGEAEYIQSLGGKVIWVDADPRVRYARISKNVHARGRAGEDDKTFEEFMAEEEREMQHSGDSATLNMSAVKERADIFLENNGNDIDAFKDAAEKALGLGVA